MITPPAQQGAAFSDRRMRNRWKIKNDIVENRAFFFKESIDGGGIAGACRASASRDSGAAQRQRRAFCVAKRSYPPPLQRNTKAEAVFDRWSKINKQKKAGTVQLHSA